MKRLILSVLFCLSVLLSAPARPFFFVQMTDPQLGFKEKDGFEQGLALLSETVDAINRIRPDFVVVTGDMTNNRFNEAQWAAYREQMDRIDKSIPVWHIPGNHDLKPREEGDVDHYLSRFGYERFSFRHKGSAFIGINSCYLKDKCFEQEKEQCVWMLSELRKARKARHIFLFTHCPVIKSDPLEAEDYFNFQEPYRSFYFDVCERYGVDAVISGHLHRSRYCDYKGVQYITASASGLPLGDGISGINIITVDKNGFSTQFVPASEAKNPLTGK